MKPQKILWLIIGITVLSIFLDLPKDNDLNFSFGSLQIKKEIKTRLGLDLQGGTHLVLQTEMKEIEPANREEALASARTVIEKRVNFYGLTEPVVQSQKVGNDYRIIVELPGLKDKETAIAEIGQTALLEFREWKSSESAVPTGITGRDLKKANVEFDSQNGSPGVSIEFTSVGAKKFADLTTRLVNKPLPIFLDQIPISNPVVNEPIKDGKARISGQFTVEQAQSLARQLNAGALPVPIKVIEERSIGATLGAESVNKSVCAGFLGLILVAGFMLLYYGTLGFLADLALIIYGLLSLAIFKLIPVTLTLPGIAGFLLSIGMAVDANILIFERMKEEMREGKPWQIAMELGFGRAWNSIRDANFTTLITCFVLFNPLGWDFLPSFGLVRGFALTLALGVIISLFTGIVVTRTLLRLFYRGKVASLRGA